MSQPQCKVFRKEFSLSMVSESYVIGNYTVVERL